MRVLKEQEVGYYNLAHSPTQSAVAATAAETHSLWREGILTLLFCSFHLNYLTVPSQK